MNLREAAQQALEALVQIRTPLRINTALDAYDVSRAIAALRTALAEPDRKPLTDKELKFIADQYGSVFGGWEIGFARAVIEAYEAKQRGGEA